MAASKPTYQKIPSIQNNPFTLNFYLRSLAYGLGCFPLDLGPSRSKSVYFFLNTIPLIVLLTSKKPIKHPPKLIIALPELLQKMRYLNSFRRKPAITRNV